MYVNLSNRWYDLNKNDYEFVTRVYMCSYYMCTEA